MTAPDLHIYTGKTTEPPPEGWSLVLSTWSVLHRSGSEAVVYPLERGLRLWADARATPSHNRKAMNIATQRRNQPMPNDDLIRRGDALAIVAGLHSRSVGERARGLEEAHAALRALPAVQIRPDYFALAMQDDEPIGVWDEVREDGRGLFVKGRIHSATLTMLTEKPHDRA